MIKQIGCLFLLICLCQVAICADVSRIIQEADSLRKVGNYDLAIKRYFEAKAFGQQEEMDSLVSEIDYQIGKVYYKMEQYALALPHYREGVRLHRENNTTKRLAHGYTMLGGCHRKLGALDSALQMQRLALRHCTMTKDTVLLPTVYINLGIAFRHLDELDSASHYYQFAHRFYRAQKDTNGLISVGINQGRLLILMGQYERGMRLMKEGYQFALHLKNLPLQRRLLANMAEGERMQKNYRAADSLSTEHHALDESIKGLATQQAIAEIEAKYQANERQRELTQSRSKERNYLIAGAVMLVIILLLAFAIWQRRKGRNKAEAEIASRLQTEIGGNLLTAQRYLRHLNAVNMEQMESYRVVEKAIKSNIKAVEELTQKPLEAKPESGKSKA